MVGFEEILSSEEEEVEKVGEARVSCCGDDADDEDDLLAQFLESEVLAVDSDQEDMPSVPSKRLRVEENIKNSPGMTLQKCFHSASDGNQMHGESEIITKLRPTFQSRVEGCGNNQGPRTQSSIENGVFGKIPIELFQKILKFLSSEDLVTCALVCRFLNSASSDESLWRRLPDSPGYGIPNMYMYITGQIQAACAEPKT